MRDKVCPICSNAANKLLVRDGTQYWQCFSCKVIFCEEVSNDDMVGGGFEIERNTNENHIRLSRIDEMCDGMKKEEIELLDFGCGHGYLVRDLQQAGYNCDGYDLYSEQYRILPAKGKYHIAIMVEVLEHMVSPFIELDVIHRSLKENGILYVETGFINTLGGEGVSVHDWFYVNPNAGHNTIFSHHAIDVLMMSKSFVPVQHYNQNTRLFRKIVKT